LVFDGATPLEPQNPIEFEDLLTTPLDESQVGPCRTMLSNSLAGIQLTTGSGKTITCANAIALVLRSSPGERAVFIVPRANLLHQTVRELKSVMSRVFSPTEIGVIGDSEFDVTPGVTRLAVGVAKESLYSRRLPSRLPQAVGCDLPHPESSVRGAQPQIERPVGERFARVSRKHKLGVFAYPRRKGQFRSHRWFRPDFRAMDFVPH
jgi:Type III restriction enzyme, res subunit